MKLFKKKVDERQELELLRVEHVCFWLGFWALFISIIVQTYFMNAPFIQFAPELFIFIAVCIALLIGCMRKGLWDYSTEPTMKTYFISSLIGAVGVTIVLFLSKIGNAKFYGANPRMLIFLGVLYFAVTFIACFAVTAAVGKVVNNKRKNLEKEYSDSDK